MDKKPAILVFAGPNGSGKSTITKVVDIYGDYINADDIQDEKNISAKEAAIIATELREKHLSKKEDFTFETVLSTERNLDLLRRAKKKGYFIKCFYVLTKNYDINIERVKGRVQKQGHDVPNEKIRKRYRRALKLIPELVDVCDVIHIYDNSGDTFTRIFKKKKDIRSVWENDLWSIQDINKLTTKVEK